MLKKASKKMRLRVLPFLMCLIMVFMLTACGAAGDDVSGDKKSGSGDTNGATAEMKGDEAPEDEGGFAGGEVSGEAGTSDMSESEVKGDTGAAADVDGFAETEGYVADSAGGDGVLNKFSAVADKEIAGEGEKGDIAGEIDPDEIVPKEQIKAGTLTAGAWDDNENWGFYRNLFAKSSDYNVYCNSWGMNFEHRIRVKVTDKGRAVKLARVSLLDGSRQVIWENVSRYDGYADVFYATDKNNTAEPKYIKVEKDGKTEEIELEAVKYFEDKEVEEEGQNSGGNAGNRGNEIAQPFYEFKDEYTVELSGTVEGEKKLDLMFVVDTTGSMSDEITFLQTELEDVINSVKSDNSNISVRVSMNFYKDEGDSYVVDSHEFTSNIDEAQKLINSEYADGGGDYPEAVDQALSDAVSNHDWDKGSVKIMFLLLDAPPHEGAQVNKTLLDSIRKAGSEGIRIIPVSASGIDKKTEFLLRAMAISTDGTYVFLTDDSGVGESHIQPTIGDYDVELLNELMIRLINKYLG